MCNGFIVTLALAVGANRRRQVVYVHVRWLIYLHWLIESNSLWKVTALQGGGQLMQVLPIHWYKAHLY